MHEKLRQFQEQINIQNESNSEVTVFTPEVKKGAVISFEIKPEELKALADRQNILLSTPNISIEDVKVAKREVVKYRTSIEKLRKEEKDAALKYGQHVDGLAKEAQKPIALIESKYDEIIDAHEAELERQAAEFARIEAEKTAAEERRIADIEFKIMQLNDFLVHASTSESHAIRNLLEQVKLMNPDEVNYMEFREKALEVYNATYLKLSDMLNARMQLEYQWKEAARIKKEADEREAAFAIERAKFEAEKKAQQDRIDTENRILNEKRLETDRAEMNRLNKIEAERIEKELRSKAEEERIEREKAAAIQAEENRKAKEALDIKLKEAEESERLRKITQEQEDKIKQNAGRLFQAIKELLKCNLRNNLIGGYEYQIELAENAFVNAGGNLENINYN